MRQYKWVKGVLTISNIIYGIKAVIWIGISALDTIFSIAGIIRHGMGEYEFYMLIGGILVLLVNGAIPATASVCYSIVVCSSSKKWLKDNLKKCKVNMFVDSCIKMILFLVDGFILLRIIPRQLTSEFPVDMWIANIEGVMLLICVVLFVLNLVSLFLIKKIAYK